MCVSPLLLACCFVCCISSAAEDQAEGGCLECLVCWLTSPRPNGRRSIDPVTEAAVCGTWSGLGGRRKRPLALYKPSARQGETASWGEGGSCSAELGQRVLFVEAHEGSCIHHTTDIKGPVWGGWGGRATHGKEKDMQCIRRQLILPPWPHRRAGSRGHGLRAGEPCFESRPSAVVQWLRNEPPPSCLQTCGPRSGSTWP